MAQHETGNVGYVIQVIGPVIDVQFPEHHLPEIHNAVHITSEGFEGPEPINIVAEVAQHLGEGRVRAVAMTATEGVVRGMKAVDLGGPIAVPVGRATLGRVDERAGRAWSMASARYRPINAIQSIALRLHSSISPPNSKCSKPASRLSICSNRTSRAEKLASSAARASAKRF